MSLPVVPATLVQSAGLVLALAALWLGARGLVDGAVRLARRAGLSEVVIGLTVVALGTSSPELVVTVDAALSGLGDLAVGNLVGSNLFNVAVTMGVLAVLRAVPVSERLLRRDGLALLASTGLLAVVLLDRTVGTVEGAVLVTGFVVYTAYLVTSSRRRTASEVVPAGTEVPARGSSQARRFGPRHAALLVGGLVAVILGGELLVTSATGLARGLEISEWVIANTVVAAGTSTPELAVSVVALGRGSLGVSVGNLLGSNVTNSLAALGVAGLVGPVSVGAAALPTVGWLVVLTVLVVLALATGRVLSRVEGGLLLASEAVRWTVGVLGRGLGP